MEQSIFMPITSVNSKQQSSEIKIGIILIQMRKPSPVWKLFEGKYHACFLHIQNPHTEASISKAHEYININI